MTRHFSIPTMLRMTPQPLLRQFLARLGHADLPISWESLPSRDIRPILAAIRGLPPPEFAAIETGLHQVFDLACDSGIHAIREAGGDAFVKDSVLFLPQSGGPYNQAMWTWLHHSEVFDRATMIHQVERLTRWRKRKGLPQVAPHTTSQVLQQFATAVSELLLEKEGRGRRCTIEHFRRADGADWFLAYPDDFVQPILVHDEDGELTPRSLRPTFEMVFAYDSQEGVLELNAKLYGRIKPLLEDAFCQIILGEGNAEADSRYPYDLNVLKDGPSRLVTDPEDRCRAWVSRMRLRVSGTRRHITLEADPHREVDDVYMMLGEYINKEKIPPEHLDITSAGLCLDFFPVEGRKPGKMSFDITHPDLCNVRDHRPDHVAIAQKYLKKWRIAVA